MTFERKHIRLGKQHYVGCRTYFLTICCDQRRHIFRVHEKAQWAIDRLREHATLHHFAVLAYCIMPDHLHTVVEGLDPTSDLLQFVKTFKQATGFHYKKKCGQQLWQKKFYDYILRPNDSLDRILWYVWMNPVRKNFCSLPRDYPFSGSFALDWKRSKNAQEPWTPPHTTS